MSKMINRRVRLGEAGLVQGTTQGPWNFIYGVSAVKDPKWNIGDSVELPNGKSFVYCKSSGVCYTGQGNSLFNAVPATGIDYSAVYAAAAIGAMSIKMTNQGVVAQTEDGLAGGTIILNHSGTSDNSDLQMRGIVGNTAGGVSDVITIYLDAPLTAALTTSSYAFCMPSPYSSVKAGDLPACSKVGIAATYVSAANMYHWEQYEGRCWIAPQAGCGSTVHGREVVWRSDGSIQLRALTTGATVNGEEQQVAGYIMDNNTAANGSTEIMLTGHF